MYKISIIIDVSLSRIKTQTVSFKYSQSRSILISLNNFRRSDEKMYLLVDGAHAYRGNDIM